VGLILFLIGAGITMLFRGQDADDAPRPNLATRREWRMPPLATRDPARMSLSNRVWMMVLCGYLVIAAGMVIVRIVQLALATG